MHRFFVPKHKLSGKYFLSEEKELVHQLRSVLKMRTGEKIVLLNNEEIEFLVELTDTNKNFIQGKILKKEIKPDISGKKSIHLFLPPLKNPNRWEWMIEKCTEIGVASFTPLITERTEIKSLRKIDRLERIIKEAAEQSGRTKLPVIHNPVEFNNVIASLSNGKARQSRMLNLIACLHPSAQPLPSLKTNEAKNYKLYVGPVGDFTSSEVQLAIDHGFLPISLGSQILRTETAAVIASALLLNQ